MAHTTLAARGGRRGIGRYIGSRLLPRRSARQLNGPAAAHTRTAGRLAVVWRAGPLRLKVDHFITIA